MSIEQLSRPFAGCQAPRRATWPNELPVDYCWPGEHEQPNVVASETEVDAEVTVVVGAVVEFRPDLVDSFEMRAADTIPSH